MPRLPDPSAARPGFNLVELLIVVVLIGILASIVTQNFSGARDKAKTAQIQGNVHAIQLGLEQYAVDWQGKYPPTLSGPKFIVTPGSPYLNASLEGQYPKTPWNQVQTFDIAYSSASLGQDEGPGVEAFTAPASNTFGEIGYEVTSAPGRPSGHYALFGEGKKGQDLLRAANLANY